MAKQPVVSQCDEITPLMLIVTNTRVFPGCRSGDFSLIFREKPRWKTLVFFLGAKLFLVCIKLVMDKISESGVQKCPDNLTPLKKQAHFSWKAKTREMRV